MNIIYLKMKKINILSYLDNFKPKSNTIQTPKEAFKKLPEAKGGYQ